MTPENAAAMLEKYVKPSNGRNGLCAISTLGRLVLDHRQPVNVAGTIIKVIAYYPVHVGSNVSGNVMAGSGQLTTYYKMQRGKFSIDIGTLTKIRVQETTEETLKWLVKSCPNIGPGYLVDLNTSRSLPDNGRLSINVPDQETLDSVLAVLSYFSPQARLVQGVGF